MIDVSIYSGRQPHGVCAQALCIPNAHLHEDRLKLAVAMLKGVRITSLLDAGCGFGDLVPLLPPGIRYTGVDATDWIICEAKVRRPDLRFLSVDVFHYVEAQPRSFDAVAALGLLATIPPEHLAHALRTLRCAATKLVVISWQDRERYRGAFHGYTLAEIEAVLGKCRSMASVAGDTEITAAFVP